ncbi:hypothetical protein IIA28_13620, partial [candidate division KSB1 bacterium]|nr:hypothetical protein [candidate division KSB1 bacterium]
MRTKSQIEKLDITSEAPGLLPLLPMLYIAWSDGILTPSELKTIKEKLEIQNWMTKSEQKILAGWLDPASPPSPSDLLNWLKIIRQSAGKIPLSSRKTLVDLGVEVARIGAKSESDRCTTPEACVALGVIEQALGVVSAEAARDVLFEAADIKPAKAAKAAPKAAFDVQAMSRLLDG